MRGYYTRKLVEYQINNVGYVRKNVSMQEADVGRE